MNAMSKPKDLFTRIAVKAGVSPSTVTLALQDSPRISLETKERVFRASRQIHYRRSRIRGTHHLNFAVVYGKAYEGEVISSSPDIGFWEGLANRATQSGVSLYTHSMSFRDDKIHFKDLPTIFRRDQVDGVVLMGVINDPFVNFLEEMKIPVVILGNVDTRRSVNQIRIDYDQGVRRLMEALLHRGHKRIGFITSSAGIAVNRQFMSGYQTALRSAGLFSNDLVRASPKTFANGFEMTTSLLHLKPRPTAILATAWDLCQQSAIAAARAGVTFDSGFEVASSHSLDHLDVGYPLHLLHVNAPSMGEKGFDRLMELRDHHDQAAVTLLLACTLRHQAAARF